MDQSNRGAWIIGGAILIAAAAIIIVMLTTRASDRECEEWQANIREVVEISGVPASAFGDDEKRPGGCPLP